MGSREQQQGGACRFLFVVDDETQRLRRGRRQFFWPQEAAGARGRGGADLQGETGWLPDSLQKDHGADGGEKRGGPSIQAAVGAPEEGRLQYREVGRRNDPV